MECPDCGAENDYPAGETLLLDEIFEDHIDVDAGAQEHVQLECPDCGAVLGYLGSAAAIGSSNVRGYY
jgi:NMD protein affecting ribosome stability and mRNA decay